MNHFGYFLLLISEKIELKKQNQRKMSRSRRAELAKETLKIIEQGFYQNQKGTEISLKTDIQNAIENSQLLPLNYWRNQELNEIEFRLINEFMSIQKSKSTQISVVNETSLSASRKLVESGGGAAKVLCLNFASAKNPGGGFLGGSQAQEESLARSSALYPTLTEYMEDMYEFHRRGNSCLYSHTMIYSPAVPVFRDDADQLLDKPYLLSFLTSPAVNAGAVKRNEPNKVDQIEGVMLERIERVLALAVEKEYQKLVLGAWGCGVFRNQPSDMAQWFAHFLLNNGKYANAFEEVVFAVLDGSKEEKFIAPFEAVFAVE